MTTDKRCTWLPSIPLGVALLLSVTGLVATPVAAQLQGVEDGQWLYLGGDAGHARYTPATQITAANFDSVDVAWYWDASSFGPSTPRATPTYVDGRLITVTGERRHVVALDPATGELLWSYSEPKTERYEYSMRKGYGKGVAYGEVDGRGVVFITSPAFFLTALDAESGQPLENWGTRVDLPGFPRSGVVDLVPPLIEDWGPWQSWGQPYDADQGIPRELGYITSSSPPIVVNGTVVVGNSAEQGYNQTRIENVPGDIMGFDARSGSLKWKFHVIPRPGEFGHDTWENDAWQFTGDVSSWAPMSADPDLNLVYIPTNGVTIDYYGGFSPGDNLYSTSLIALNADTGERVWHYQMVHHDIWNYDTPTAPILMDVNVDGRTIPGIFQVTKQGFVYALDRRTGEPIWPIPERPVPASRVPGEKLSPTQPFPTKPAPFDLQGRQEKDLIDYSPELRRMAYEYASANDLFVPLFDPPTHIGDNGRPGLECPGGGGGANITGAPSADPVQGLLFISSSSGCSPIVVAAGAESPLDGPHQTGVTHSDWSRAIGAQEGIRPDQAEIDGLSIWKGPVGRIVAYDMNSGEMLWTIPNGDAPEYEQEAIRSHPLLGGIPNVPTNPGRRGTVGTTASPNLLFASGQTADDTPVLFAIDKRTGRRVGQVEIPGISRYGMSSWVHEGRQYILIQLNDGLAAMNIGGWVPPAAPVHQ